MEEIKNMEEEFKLIDKESKIKLKDFITDVFALSGETYYESDSDGNSDEEEDSEDSDEDEFNHHDSDYNYY